VTAEDAPSAPAPRPKGQPQPKPWAELLVGTWKMVKTDGVALPPEVDARIEFTRDAKFSVRAHDPKNGHQTKAGTYALHGGTLRLTTPAGPDGPGKSWEVTIEALSDGELSTSAGPALSRQRSVFKRVEAK
jgi:uncharacterized protein (TIGR03066 family)